MHNSVEQFNIFRKSEMETLIVAVLMATGVNVLVSGIAMVRAGTFWGYITTGLIILIVSVVLYRYCFISTNSIHKRVRGFFLYDSEKREIMCIPDYDAGLRMWNYMRASSAEIQRVWKNNTIGNLQYIGGRIVAEETESDRIISELLEYCVIEILSTCLTDYYDGKSEKYLTKIGRNDVPDIMQNRFLYWYSQEPEHGDDLKKCLEIDGCTMDEALLRMAKAGGNTKAYSRFELILPKGTTVSRKENKIFIESPLFVLTIKCLFTGSNTITPTNFKKLYLKTIENENDIKAFSMYVDVDVQFKSRCLFSSDITKKCAWIDAFLDNLDKMISEERFYEKIGWRTAETVIRCVGIQSKE